MRDIINFEYGTKHGKSIPKIAKGKMYTYRSFFDILDTLSKNNLDETIKFMSNDEDYKKAISLDFAIKREIYINGVDYIVPSEEQTKKQQTLLNEYNDLVEKIMNKFQNTQFIMDEESENQVMDIQGYKYQPFFNILDILADYDANWVLEFINNHGENYNKAINLDFTIKRVCLGLGNSALSYDNFYVKGLLEEYEGLITNIIRGYMLKARYQRTDGIPLKVATLFNNYLDSSLYKETEIEKHV